MATDTNKQMNHADSRTLWTILGLVAITIVAYAAYATYYHTDRFGNAAVETTVTRPNTD